MSPRSQKLNDQMRSQTLAKIDSAALKVFAACGYHGATMRRIAQAAGLSYGLVYHYYPSKAKVFRRLVDFASGRARWRRCSNSCTPPASPGSG